MEFTCERAEIAANDWREVLLVAFETGLPSLFNLDCLVDRAEGDERDRPWR